MPLEPLHAPKIDGIATLEKQSGICYTVSTAW